MSFLNEKDIEKGIEVGMDLTESVLRMDALPVMMIGIRPGEVKCIVKAGFEENGSLIEGLTKLLNELRTEKAIKSQAGQPGN